VPVLLHAEDSDAYTTEKAARAERAAVLVMNGSDLWFNRHGCLRPMA
jgi:hypothetical protein